MKCNGRRCDGFTTLEVLLCLTALSVAVSVCMKWYVSQSHQYSMLRQKWRLVPCADAFALHIREQPHNKACVGTWYAVRNASKAEKFDFVRQRPASYDFRITVGNNAWAPEKTARFCIRSQGVTEENIAESTPEKPEFLIVRFYAEGKTHCLHTCFVPVTAKKFKAEEWVSEPIERFMLTPKTEKSSNFKDK